MTEPQISIAFQTNKTAADYIALAKFINPMGFHTITVYCDAPFQPSYGPLLLMAPHITQARLGPAAVSPFRIHPLDIAANTALLDSLAPGRTYIGLARGAWLSAHGITEPRKALTGIRESIEIIKQILKGESAGIDGEVFQIANHVRAPYPLPTNLPPLLIGTWGKKLAEIASNYADEVKIGGSTSPAMVKTMQGMLNNEKVGIVSGAVTLVDEDRDQARTAAKEAAALYIPVIARLDPNVSIDPELLGRMAKLVEQGNTAEAARLISDDLLDSFAFSGNVDDITNQAAALFDAGARRIEFGTPHGIDSHKGIALLGQKVLPRIQKL